MAFFFFAFFSFSVKRNAQLRLEAHKQAGKINQM